MVENTKIAWAHHTFNPWQGCQKVSSGCDNCYAEARDARFNGGVHWGPKADRKRTKTWGGPVKWNKEAERLGIRYRVFCASLADIFDNHKSIKQEWRDELWALIKATPHLDWLLLTKRPQNIGKFLPDDYGPENYFNVWLGTTVENQEEANRRIKPLLRHYAKHHFLSCEPLLNPVDLTKIDWSVEKGAEKANILSGQVGNYLKSYIHCSNTIDWVIIGGESGPNARTFYMDFASDIIEQCSKSNIAVFMKQLGKRAWYGHHSFGAGRWRTEHKKGEDPTEWPPEFRVQQFPGEM